MGSDSDSKTASRPREDVNSLTSRRGGALGFVEILLRRTRTLAHVAMMIPLYGLACVCLGLALVPGIVLFEAVIRRLDPHHWLMSDFATGASLAAGYFIYGFSLMLIVPTANFLLRTKLRAWRGPYYSLEAIPWYIHNGATYLLRYTFLEFITPTPFNLLFYRWMGMKIGRGTIINSTFISDPSLIEMGNKVTIGGSVTIVAHYGQGGYLVLAPVKIGDGATIGLKSTIMGGAIIGKNAKILPNSVVLPNTTVPDGETWGGVPAQKFSVFHKAA